jgi:hypothetical protein
VAEPDRVHVSEQLGLRLLVQTWRPAGGRDITDLLRHRGKSQAAIGTLNRPPAISSITDPFPLGQGAERVIRGTGGRRAILL